MQSRREFLSAASVTLLMIPLGAACSSSSSDATGTAPGACDGAGATSSVANDHTHTVCVPTADLTNPPAAGASYTTSTDFSHSHTVTLTQAQLSQIEAGKSVKITSTGVEPNHDFVLVVA